MPRLVQKGTLVWTVCAAVLAHWMLAGPSHAQDLGRSVYQRNSLYNRIFVYRRGSVVTLQFGQRRGVAMQSQVDMSDLRRHMFEYTALSFCGLLYKEEPKRLLVLGLGGGVIPREMRHYFPDLEIDVAEIDPDIPPIAERFFGFRRDDKLKVHITDGRVFIRNRLREDPVRKYDLIILDAFNSDYIPFHLMTREFLREVQGLLADDGVVVANVFYSDRLFEAELKTFLLVFGRCQTFFGAYSTNAMIVALGPEARLLSAQETANGAAALQSKHKFAFDLRAVARRLRPNTYPAPSAQVLTDDRAPVNWLRKQNTERTPDRSPERTGEDQPLQPGPDKERNRQSVAP